MFRMGSILHGFQKIVEPGQPTHVFRRALAHGLYAPGQGLCRLAPENFSQGDLMLPAVTKIVLVFQCLPLVHQNTGNRHPRLIHKIHHAVEIFLRITQQRAIQCLKQMKVRPPPPHCNLNDSVQILQRGTRSNQQPPPNGGLRSNERNIDLVNTATRLGHELSSQSGADPGIYANNPSSLRRLILHILT